MIGAICGDIIGSVHEGAGTKTKDFPLFVPHCRFTDDTVLTVAVAARLLHGGSYTELFQDYFHAYPQAGYGGSFAGWARQRRRRPYGSWGNGAAMRVSPIGFACRTLDEALVEARRSAEVTHDHAEGIRGAQATAAAVFLARTGSGKVELRSHIEDASGYRLGERLDDIREDYRFDVFCQGSVPPSIIAFVEADDYEDAVRNAISLGGDADTMAAIAGGIAEAFYGGVPEPSARRPWRFSMRRCGPSPTPSPRASWRRPMPAGGQRRSLRLRREGKASRSIVGVVSGSDQYYVHDRLNSIAFL